MAIIKFWTDFCIQIGNRKEFINVSRLKPCYSESVQACCSPSTWQTPCSPAWSRSPARRSYYPWRTPWLCQSQQSRPLPPRPPTRQPRALVGGNLETETLLSLCSRSLRSSTMIAHKKDYGMHNCTDIRRLYKELFIIYQSYSTLRLRQLTL